MQSPFPTRSLVRDGQPSPHKPLLYLVTYVLPHANSFVVGTGTVVINNNKILLQKLSSNASESAAVGDERTAEHMQETRQKADESMPDGLGELGEDDHGAGRAQRRESEHASSVD